MRSPQRRSSSIMRVEDRAPGPRALDEQHHHDGEDGDVAATMDAALVTALKIVSWLPSTTFVTCSGVTLDDALEDVELRLEKLSCPPVPKRLSRMCGSARMKSSDWMTTG